MRLRLVKERFDDPEYIFELKHDGFPEVVCIQNGECKIISRNQRQLRFESLGNPLVPGLRFTVGTGLQIIASLLQAQRVRDSNWLPALILGGRSKPYLTSKRLTIIQAGHIRLGFVVPRFLEPT